MQFDQWRLTRAGQLVTDIHTRSGHSVVVVVVDIQIVIVNKLKLEEEVHIQGVPPKKGDLRSDLFWRL